MRGKQKPLTSDAPFFVKDYYDYHKTNRGYHKRSLNSNDGWAIYDGGDKDYIPFDKLDSFLHEYLK